MALRLLLEFPMSKDDGARLLKILGELLPGVYGLPDGDHPLRLRR
jgi:hypothetical protein